MDEAYHELLEKGLKPVSEPRNRPGGIREFMLRDPDGSLASLFQKKVSEQGERRTSLCFAGHVSFVRNVASLCPGNRANETSLRPLFPQDVVYSSRVGELILDPQPQRKETMPKPSQYALVWSHASQHYELHTQGQLIQCFREGEEATFSRWLDAHTSFAFVGQNGRLSVLKEARPRGSGYWYAYQKQGRQTRKRYLGRSNQVTFARLELVAHILTNRPEPFSFAPEPGTPSSEAQGMLLSSKLSPPRLPHALVERTRSRLSRLLLAVARQRCSRHG